MSEGAAALAGVQTVAPEPSDNSPATSTGSSWTSGFDEDTSAYIQKKGWDSPSSLLESYRNLEKFAGGSKHLVELPGADADETAYSRFYDALGRPESPDKYGIELPEGGDEGLFNWFRETAHRHGMSEKQTQAFYNEWNEMTASRMEDMQHEFKVQAENDISDLKREWGRDYDVNIDAGKRAVNALGYDEQKLSQLEERMGTGEMLRLFATIGARMGEDTFADGDTSDSGFGMSSSRAKQELGDLKMDKQFMNAYLSGDKDAVNKMQRLMEKAYGA